MTYRTFFFQTTFLILMCLGSLWGVFSFWAQAEGHRNFLVYSILTPLPMENKKEPLQKDYYLNMGSRNGVHQGSILEVYRKTSTFDLIRQELYYEAIFPIGQLKVIHAEPYLSIARLHKLYPDSQTPIFFPHAILIGDLIRPLSSR